MVGGREDFDVIVCTMNLDLEIDFRPSQRSLNLVFDKVTLTNYTKFIVLDAKSFGGKIYKFKL